jgi:hypothetical protein
MLGSLVRSRRVGPWRQMAEYTDLAGVRDRRKLRARHREIRRRTAIIAYHKTAAHDSWPGTPIRPHGGAPVSPRNPAACREPAVHRLSARRAAAMELLGVWAHMPSWRLP